MLAGILVLSIEFVIMIFIDEFSNEAVLPADTYDTDLCTDGAYITSYLMKTWVHFADINKILRSILGYNLVIKIPFIITITSFCLQSRFIGFSCSRITRE